MNKYQEAFNNFKKLKYIPNAVNLTMNLDLLQKDIVVLQELVDKEKTYTEEEIKKEWEKLGYEWEKRENIILIYNRKIDKMISIHTIDRGYSCSDSDGVGLWITFQEHQLLTKTFKWLGWEEVENVINM